MMPRDPSLELASGPFLRSRQSTTQIMWEVFAALVPVVIAATWFFGVVALLVVAASCAGAVSTEWWFGGNRRRPEQLRDGTALLTGMLLGLTLPPTLPLWMAFLGGVVAVGLGKLIWGGLGYNLFNPALVGRAFLQTAFPVAITTWMAPRQGFLHLPPSTLAAPFLKSGVDGVSTATPLGLSKFDQVPTELSSLLLGSTPGSLGETFALLLLACGAFLIARKVLDWRLCVSTLVSVALFSGILHLVDASAYPSPGFMLCSGGLMFGAVFMVTDPVTTPLTPRGAWVYGGGVGFLVVLIRLFGGLPESVMYAILIMNAFVPHINRYCHPRQFQA